MSMLDHTACLLTGYVLWGLKRNSHVNKNKKIETAKKISVILEFHLQTFATQYEIQHDFQDRAKYPCSRIKQ
jgi:hypothetical protein